MAKVEGPLLSQAAHGSVGKILTFSKRQSGQQARGYNKPTKTPTPKQRGQRRLTEFLVAQWQNMSDATKASWKVLAGSSKLNITGYQYFLREAQRDLYTHAGLECYLSFNEIVGGKVLDISGQSNHGTLGPDYPSDAPVLADPLNVKSYKSLYFDGSNDKVTLPSAAACNYTVADSFSLICWLKASAGYGDRQEHIISKVGWGPAATSGYMLRNSWDRMTFRVGNGDDAETLESAWGAVSGGKQMFAAVYDVPGEKMYLYHNGVELKNQAITIGGDITEDTPVRIGTDQWNDEPYKGNIDEVCIYKRAFSAAELLTRYKMATS